jgi:RimK family alpha-L-glutamate ligase
VAIVTERRGWHEQRLAAALRERGVAVGWVALGSLRFASSRSGCRVEVPGFAGDLPDAVLVRGIPGGSFEQVTLRLDLLHALRESGVTVYNDARVIERTVDKAMTSFLLTRRGVPTPPTWVCQSERQAHAVLRRERAAGRRVVLKPLFGSCGDGLRLLDDWSSLPAADEYRGVYYLQRFVGADSGPFRDWRVMVIGGRSVAAMERRAERWITNRAQGGKCLPAALDTEITELAEAAARAVGASYAGVDLIRHPDGRPTVLEVNGIPAWVGLQRVTALDIAGLLADDLLRNLLPRRWEAAS